MGRHITEEVAADRTCPPAGTGLIFAVAVSPTRVQLTGIGGLLAPYAGRVIRFHFVAGTLPNQCWLRFGDGTVSVDRTAVTPAATTADLVLENGAPEEFGLPDDPTAAGLYVAFEGSSAGKLILSVTSP